MRAFLTGATGFIGGRVARELRTRGDEVVALVRSPAKASELAALGCELVEGDLTSEDVIRQAMTGCDAAFHMAAVYKVGIPSSEREAMQESNVRGSEVVFDAAIDAGLKRIVYVSTIAVFGNTGGEVVDESYDRSEADGFLSCYDETKFRSHQAAMRRIAGGAPIVIVQPGGVYGPGDHSEIGNFIDQTRNGKMFLIPFPDLGLNLVHVDDVADGILLAHDKGAIGESYVLGGELATMRDVVKRTAEMSGRKPPTRALPVALMKLSRPLGPVLGPVMGFPPNFGEAIRASDGVTYWAKDDKARRELGYSPRDFSAGLEQTLAATR